MIFLLIRHGANESLGKFLPGQLPGIHLNGDGKKQADQIAACLGSHKISEIYSSPLERTMETAAPLSEKLGKTIIPENGLVEMNAGSLSGISFTTLKKMPVWKTIRRAPSMTGFPGGESFMEASERVWQCIQKIKAHSLNDSVVILFSHSDIIKLAVATSLHIPLVNFPRLTVYPASMTILGFHKETTWLGGLNLPLPYIFPNYESLTG